MDISALAHLSVIMGMELLPVIPSPPLYASPRICFHILFDPQYLHALEAAWEGHHQIPNIVPAEAVRLKAKSLMLVIRDTMSPPFLLN